MVRMGFTYISETNIVLDGGYWDFNVYQFIGKYTDRKQFKCDSNNRKKFFFDKSKIIAERIETAGFTITTQCSILMH